MATIVKGLKVDDSVILCTIDTDNLPEDHKFRGWIIEHKIAEIVNDKSVRIVNIKDQSKEFIFDFSDDEPDKFYQNPIKPNWYTGLFTNMNNLIDGYNQIYDKVKNSVNKQDNDKVSENE